MNNLEIVVPVCVTYSSKHPPTSEPPIKILERTAVVDTGAYISVIREDIVDELNLRDIGRSVAVLASGEEIECKEFLITLIITGGSSGDRPEGSVSIVFEHVRVLAVPIVFLRIMVQIMIGHLCMIVQESIQNSIIYLLYSMNLS